MAVFFGGGDMSAYAKIVPNQSRMFFDCKRDTERDYNPAREPVFFVADFDAAQTGWIIYPGLGIPPEIVLDSESGKAMKPDALDGLALDKDGKLPAWQRFLRMRIKHRDHDVNDLTITSMPTMNVLQPLFLDHEKKRDQHAGHYPVLKLSDFQPIKTTTGRSVSVPVVTLVKYAACPAFDGADEEPAPAPKPAAPVNTAAAIDDDIPF